VIIDVDLKLVQENSVHPVPIVTDVAKMPVCAAIRHTGGTNSARLRRMYASAGADVTITGEFKESRPTMLPNPVRLSGICILLALPLLACGRQPEAGVSAVTVTETAVTSLSDTESAAPEEHTDPDSSAADSTEAGSGAMAAADTDRSHEAQTATADDSTSVYEPLESIRVLQQPAGSERRKLDLSLPHMNWDSDGSRDFSSQRMPDVFSYQKPVPGMNLSGKLHWDEDQEAPPRSLEESITGAEVELQFRLP